MTDEIQGLDFIGERASKHRRSLMISCTVALAFVLTGAKPDKIPIPGSGMQAPIENPIGFFIGLMLFVLYFGTAFYLEAKGDRYKWRQLRRKDRHKKQIQRAAEWEKASIDATGDPELIAAYSDRHRPGRTLSREEKEQEELRELQIQAMVDAGVDLSEMEPETFHEPGGHAEYVRMLERKHPEINKERKRRFPNLFSYLTNEEDDPLITARGLFDLYLPLAFAAVVVGLLVLKVVFR